MRTALSAMPTMLRVAMATMLQYRGEIVLWAVWGLVFPAVSIAMWTTAAKGGRVGTFNTGEIAAYFFLTMIVGHLSAAWDVYEMGYLIRSGTMSPLLLQPILPIWVSIASNLAYKLVTLLLLAPIWLLVAWYVEPEFHTSLLHLALGIPAVLLGAAIAYLWGYVIALIAFFMTKIDAAAELYFGLTLLVGGRFAAIEWLPAPLQWLTWLFPFRWSVAYPIELLMGRLDLTAALTGLAWQLAWFGSSIVVFLWGWRRAVRHYAAVGG